MLTLWRLSWSIGINELCQPGRFLLDIKQSHVTLIFQRNPMQIGSFQFYDCSGRTIKTKLFFAENFVLFLTHRLYDKFVQEFESTDKVWFENPQGLEYGILVVFFTVCYHTPFCKVKIFWWIELTSVTANNRMTNSYKVIILCMDIKYFNRVRIRGKRADYNTRCYAYDFYLASQLSFCYIICISGYLFF